MNTFMPYGANFLKDGEALDRARLQKQLVECQQMYDALTTGRPSHILHHPATQMWEGHHLGLATYGRILYRVYRMAGFTVHKSGEYLWEKSGDAFPHAPSWAPYLSPYHRIRLQQKDPDRYRYYQQESDIAGICQGPVYPITAREGEHVGWVYRLTESSRRWSATWTAEPQAKSEFDAWTTAWSAIEFVRAQNPPQARIPLMGPFPATHHPFLRRALEEVLSTARFQGDRCSQLSEILPFPPSTSLDRPDPSSSVW